MKIMKKFSLFTIVTLFAIHARAQDMSLGLGVMDFPFIGYEQSQGYIGQLGIGNHQFILGYNGDQSVLGYAPYQEINVTDKIQFGVFAGGLLFKPDVPNAYVKKLNFQPYGGLRLTINKLIIQYSPAGNTTTLAIKL